MGRVFGSCASQGESLLPSFVRGAASWLLSRLFSAASAWVREDPGFFFSCGETWRVAGSQNTRRVKKKNKTFKPLTFYI